MSEQEQQFKTRTWTEAPASLTVKAQIRGRDTMLTLRGDTGADVLKSADALFEWLDKHAPTPEQRYETVRSPNGETSIPTPKMQGEGEKPVKVIRIEQLKVSPRDDGKVDLKFFEFGARAKGLKYPAISSSRKPEACVAMMADVPTPDMEAWTIAHFAQAGSYDVSCVLGYTLSDKLNTKGNPYKDIVSIRATED